MKEALNAMISSSSVYSRKRQMKEACVYSKHLVCTGSWPGAPGILLVTISNLIALS
jgi:hypothetical protein